MTPRYYQRLQNSPRSRRLRPPTTPLEKKLRERLTAEPLDGLVFRPQAAFGPYKLDFFNDDLKLAVEIGGDAAARAQSRDTARARFLKKKRIGVIHFSDDDTGRDLEYALGVIRVGIAARRDELGIAADPP